MADEPERKDVTIGAPSADAGDVPASKPDDEDAEQSDEE